MSPCSPVSWSPRLPLSPSPRRPVALCLLLALLLLLPLAGCGEIPTAPPLQESTSAATVEPYPPPPTVEMVPTIALPWTFPPMTDPAFTPVPTMIQPTPYAPDELLSPNFPTLIYAVDRNSIWTLSYENGQFLEKFLAGGVWGQPIHMALSFDGRYLAVNTLQWGAEPGAAFLYIVGLDGVVRSVGVPEHEAETTFYAWSPDNNEVLVTYAFGIGGLLRMDGSEFRRLPQSVDCVGGAALSPDGRYIFCFGSPPLARVEVGAGALDIAEALVPKGERPWPSIHVANFSWSPDSRQAVFTSDKLVEIYGEGQLWLMNADGTNCRPLGRDDTNDFAPDWSPDGKMIVFARRENPSDDYAPAKDPTLLVSSLWLTDVESGTERLLLASEGQYAHWSPKWLPDDSGLVFISDRGGAADIWFIRLDGTGLQQLTRQGGLDGEIVVLPQ